MAFVTPKLDWDEDYEPSPSDFIRIEGNTQANKDLATSISSDVSELQKSDYMGTRTYSTISAGAGSTQVITATGFLISRLALTGGSGNATIQIYDGSSWNTIVRTSTSGTDVTFCGPSDGVNLRLSNSGTATSTIYYVKVGG